MEQNKQLKECFNLQNDYSSYFKLSNLRNLKRDTLYKIKRIEAEIEMERNFLIWIFQILNLIRSLKKNFRIFSKN